MNIAANIVDYCGRFFFATIMFIAMIISTVVSLPFIGAGMIKDALSSHHQHADQNSLFDFYS
jgi:biotin transporter BioY